MAKAYILVVEDEHIVAKDIRQELQRLGYIVPDVVSSGEDAIEKSGELHPDLVLMDIMLKGKIDGIKAAEKIRVRFDIPVVFLTAYADEDTLNRAKITEPFGYLLKPFDSRDMHITIEMALYKHRIDSRLRESQQWLSTLLTSIGDAVIATDNTGAISFMNQISEKLTGWSSESAMGKELTRVFNTINGDTGLPLESPAKTVLLSNIATCFSKNCLLHSKEGLKIPIEFKATSMVNNKGNVLGVVLVFHDVSESKLAEETIRRAEEQQRLLSERLVKMQEEERLRIARELHDDLGQSLTALRMDVTWLQNLLKEGMEIHTRLRQMVEVSDTLIDTVRSISYELRPSVLDDLGLVNAIESYAHQFEVRSNIACMVDLGQLDDPISKEVALAAYRIYQEALTNVARHSQADEVSINLRQEDNEFVLEVQDNGKGFYPDTLSSKTSMGLLGMKARARMVGGWLEIKSKKAKGTVVIARFPFQRKEEEL
jgi:PAS domain S-box-containing protein